MVGRHFTAPRLQVEIHLGKGFDYPREGANSRSNGKSIPGILLGLTD